LRKGSPDISNTWGTFPQERAYKTTLPCGKVSQILVIHGECFRKGELTRQLSLAERFARY